MMPAGIKKGIGSHRLEHAFAAVHVPGRADNIKAAGATWNLMVAVLDEQSIPYDRYASI
jgi:hypothetical protein